MFFYLPLDGLHLYSPTEQTYPDIPIGYHRQWSLIIGMIAMPNHAGALPKHQSWESSRHVALLQLPMWPSPELGQSSCLRCRTVGVPRLKGKPGTAYYHCLLPSFTSMEKMCGDAFMYGYVHDITCMYAHSVCVCVSCDILWTAQRRLRKKHLSGSGEQGYTHRSWWINKHEGLHHFRKGVQRHTSKCKPENGGHNLDDVFPTAGKPLPRDLATNPPRSTCALPRSCNGVPMFMQCLGQNGDLLQSKMDGMW